MGGFSTAAKMAWQPLAFNGPGRALVLPVAHWWLLKRSLSTAYVAACTVCRSAHTFHRTGEQVDIQRVGRLTVMFQNRILVGGG
jgi:hypothetical protein